MKRSPLLLLFIALLAWAQPGSAAAAITERLQLRVGSLAEDPRVAGQPVADRWLLTRFYERREFTPAWDRIAKLDELLEAIIGSAGHGLEPEDYHLSVLTELVSSLRREAVPGLAAETDLLATDALARLAFHLRFGKVNPERFESTWNFTRSLNGASPVAALQALLKADDLRVAVAALAPDEAYYRAMQASLARYREIAAQGGWPRIEAGETLRLGMASPRVSALRKLLARTGDLDEGAPVEDTEVFDAELEAAVIRFQRRHGLVPDGAVGRRTLAAMNVPAEARVDQLRVNLERVRWVYRELEERFLLVNIAQYEVMLVENRRVTWRTRAVVGRPYRQTPVFKARMTYLEFNPTWTVPPTILARDLLPEIRQDPGTLQRRNMTVLDRRGQPVDPADIDWAGIPARGFPYMIRQEPGPQNALGRVKFMYPNPYHVYMHDTPARELFGHTERTFSSGCIRLERPLELAEILLAGTEWDGAAIERVLASGRTRVVNLPRPITVLTLYATVVMQEGRAHFLPDIYDRDARLLRALNDTFEFVPPAGWGEAMERYLPSAS